MIIEKVVDRFMDENTYIIGDEKTKKCAIIDPGGSTIDIFNKIKQHGLTVEYIILTHGHGDHICRVPEIKSKTNAKVIAHVNEEEVLIDRNKNLSAQLPGPLVEFEADKYVQEGDIIELGSLKFAGSIGRTDFYGGDYKQMMKSLRKLAKYDDNAVIYPGHGPTSTIGVEKRMNPYMQQI